MTATASVARARGWVLRLEDAKAKELGRNIAEARPILARELGIAPGSLENLRKNRVKAVRTHVFERLQAGVARLLEMNIAQMAEELADVRRAGCGPDPAAIGEAEAALAHAREVLARYRKVSG